MLSIDLNCDMGESTHLWPYSIEKDLSLLPYLSSVNLACGLHAGDANTIHALVGAATLAGVAVGAHPGFEDRENFGRTAQQLSALQVYNIVMYQLGALGVFGMLHHVKPHGALYNIAATDEVVATAICRAVYEFDKSLLVYGLSGSMLIKAAAAKGLATCSEVFADRTYQDDGTLTPRSQPNALIGDVQQSLDQVLQMITKGTVTSVHGKEVPIVAETVCIHGDGEHAVEFARSIHEALQARQITIRYK